MNDGDEVIFAKKTTTRRIAAILLLLGTVHLWLETHRQDGNEENIHLVPSNITTIAIL